jgi:hypothetical protein
MIKSIVTYSIIVMTIGILRLVYHWFPEWFLNCTHSKCSLESAERVLVVVSNPRHIGRFSHNSIDSLLCVYLTATGVVPEEVPPGLHSVRNDSGLGGVDVIMT